MDYEYYYTIINSSIIFSAPMPKSPGGLVVTTCIVFGRPMQVQSLARTQIFFFFLFHVSLTSNILLYHAW